MPFRHITTEISEDDFTNKMTLNRTFAGTPSVPTTYSLAGVVTGQQSDLGSLKAVILEFEADDADGEADPVERVLATTGGTLCTRAADKSTLLIAPSATPIPFARAVALRETLGALGY